MDGTGIYQGRLLSIFRDRPTDRPDAIVRKPDTGRKKHEKIVIFSMFSIKLRLLEVRYRLDVLNEDKRYHGTPFG